MSKLSKEIIEGAKVGPELDALVAEHLFESQWLKRAYSDGSIGKAIFTFENAQERLKSQKWHALVAGDENVEELIDSHYKLPAYSTDGNAMLAVLEKARNDHLFASIDQLTTGVYRVTFYEHEAPESPGRCLGAEWDAETLQEAVSKSVLLAILAMKGAA